MKSITPCLRLAIVLALSGALASSPAFAGTWSALANHTPNISTTNHGNPTLMMVLSDGGILVENDPTGGGGSSNWFKLTPDSHGSYVNGTWSILAPSSYTRAGCASDMLTNGNIFFAGGEYGTGHATAELYNTLSNSWTIIPVPTSLINPTNLSPIWGGGTLQGFSDAISEVISNGKVLIAPVAVSYSHETILYDPVANTLSAGPNLRSSSQSEASWVKLPDQSILTIDPSSRNCERYFPTINSWLADATVPVTLYSTNTGVTGSAPGELGAGFLLPDGRAIFFGATSNTAIYTPTGTPAAGSWVAGPSFPSVVVGSGTNISTNSQGCPDAPAVMMSTGNILVCTGTADTFNGPICFFEYNYVSNTLSQVNGPSGSPTNASPYYTKFIALPDGNALWNYGNPQLYVYKPSGSPIAIGKPAISNIVQNLDGSYHLSGAGLNGISEGAGYGDDAQMASSFPLVRMTNMLTGLVYYARTFNWSSTGVMTSNTPVSTEFTLPPAAPAGTYSLVAVANGISSDPVLFSFPLTRPTISSLNISNTDLMLNATGGLAGRTYSVMTSIDPAQPLNSWTPLSTNVLNANGSFSITVSNAVSSSEAARYFALRAQ